MKKVLILLVINLMIASCSGDKSSDSEQMPRLFPASEIIKLDTINGYAVNPLSGDSIKSILNSIGETVVTGKRIPAKGNSINPDSLLPMITIPLKLPELVDLEIKTNPTPIKLKVSFVNENSLKSYRSKDIKTSFILINSIGDTIPTGIPIATYGEIVPCIHPPPVFAIQPENKKDEESSFNSFNQVQGLTSTDVRSIYEDSRGNIWIGTDGGGVAQYDGVFITYFTTNEGLCNNSVLSIMEDSKGNLWFGTNGGVSRYDGRSFKNFTDKEGLANNVVWSILEDQTGIIWFGTWGGGVSRYDGEALSAVQEVASFTHYTVNEGLSNNRVISLLEDRKGNIWFGTWGGGATRYNAGSIEKGDPSFTHFTRNEGLSNNIVRSMHEDKNGIIWFGTSKGVSRYNEKKFTHYGKEEGLESSSIWSILENSRGELLFGTNAGVSRFIESSVSDVNGPHTYFQEMEGLNRNIVMSMLEDRQGNLWFGTGEDGVSRHDGNSFMYFDEKDGLKNNDLQDILEDTDGDLWFGTWGGGVSEYDEASFSHYTEKEGLCYNYITSILKDRNGNLWFGTDGEGVSRFDQQSNFTHITKKEGLSGKSVLSMLEDSKGNIWFGTNNGVTRYDGKVFTHFTEKEGLSNNVIGSILEDQSGNLWFGTWGGGLTRYDGKYFTHFTEKEGMTKNMVTSMAVDENGVIWFGTFGGWGGGGLSRFDGETFTHFTETSDFSNDVVGSMTNDREGNIWIATEKGLKLILEVPGVKEDSIESLNPGSITSESWPKIYTVLGQTGVKGVDFLSNSIFLDSKNRMWWASGKKLVALDMDDLKLRMDPPNVHLNFLEINLKQFDFHNMQVSNTRDFTFSGAEPFFNYPKDLKLHYDNNHLTFHFSAIDWKASEKIHYSYIMEGLQNEWSKPSPLPQADYLYLLYGTYTFKVRAIGESQVWSEPFEYTFTIHPPWWHTWLARTGYGIVGLWLVFGFVRLRTAQLKKRQKELETEVIVATKEIRGQRDEIEEQKEKIEEQHKKMKDSITYAKRIQSAILPSDRMVRAYLKESFILYKPKDVVAGDFYWMHSLSAEGNNENVKIMFAAADCTGHGVPGAIVSVVCNNALDRSVREYGLSDSGKILDKTRDIVVEEFEKSDEEVKDGMDIALCILDGRSLQFSGANNPLWIVRNGELLVTKGSRQPIGIYDKKAPFITHTFELEKGDIIYLSSDGYPDQFGGEKGKKFMSANFKKLILSIQGESMEKQGQLLDEAFERWRGDLEQIDDVCVIGVKI